MQVENNYFLLLFIGYLDGNPLKIKVFPDPVFQEPGIWRFKVLGEVAEECKHRVFGRQLGDVFDFNVFPFPRRRRITLDFGEDDFIQLRGRYLFSLVIVNF